MDCASLAVFSFLVWTVLIAIQKTDATCVLPSVLAGNKWTYTQNVITGQVEFGQSTLVGFAVTAKGDLLKEYTCISNTTNVYVFKSDRSYTDKGRNRWIYRCMKITEVSPNLVYLYFLSDLDKTISPPSRVYSPPAGNQPSVTQPTCDFCNFTNPPTAEEYFLLKRENTDEKLKISPIPCLPCAEDCTKDPCDPNPCQHSGSCTTIAAGYNCTCSSGWTGKNCTDAVKGSPKESNNIPIIIGVVVAVFVLVVIITFILIVRHVMRKRRSSSNEKYDVRHTTKTDFQEKE